MELNKEVITAAEVVLLIVKNEGELEDDIEYPLEFCKAYEVLLSFDIIKLVDGKYIPSGNFDSAYRIGIRKFIEKENSKNQVLLRRRNNHHKVGLAIVSSTAIAMAGYFIRRAKLNSRS